MVIKYIAYNPEGERLSGSLEAETPQAAEKILIRSNLTVVSLKKEFRFPKLSFDLQKQMPSLFRLKTQELVSFNHELASLLESGISLLPAIKVLQSKVRNSLFKRTLQQVSKDIELGISFSEACSKHPNVFPSIYIRLVTIGEATGNLRVMLHQAAIHLEKQTAMKAKVKKALKYPFVVLLIGILATIIMMTVTLPALTNLISESGGELPLNARILLSTNDFLVAYGLYMLLGFSLAGLLGWVYFRTPSGIKRKEHLLRRLPLIRGVTANSNMATFNRNLSTLLDAGIPLTEAIELTINATDSDIVRNALVEVRGDLLTGEQLSQAISRQEVFPPMVSQMITVGEQAGTLQSNVEALANLYEQATDESVDTLTGMIQPTVVVLAGGLVGFIMITLMQSVYGSMQQIT